MAEGGRLSILEYGAESFTLPGQMESGDKYVIKEIPTGAVIGVIDGLGHGTEAAQASELAAKVIEKHADEPVITIAKRCHKHLHDTRGVVMALVSMNAYENTLTWLSIGNVEGTFIRTDFRSTPGYENIVMRPGVVGFRLPPLLASVFSISRNDLLILATDGIRDDHTERIAFDFHYAPEHLQHLTETQINAMTLEAPTSDKPASHLKMESESSSVKRENEIQNISLENLANHICTFYAKGSDDAMVVVARYKGKHNLRDS